MTEPSPPDAAVPAVLAGHRLAVVDVEGNGQNPPEIIEIAVVPVDQTVTAADMRSWLVRPQQPIAPMVTMKVHGIGNADVAECPEWSDVAPEICAVLADRVLVAHGAHVEYRVISAHLPDWQPPLVLDSIRLAKHVWPDLPSYRLERLAAHAQLDLTPVADQQPHRAPYDTWCAWQLLCALVADSGFDWPALTAVAALPGFAEVSEPQGGLW